LAERYKKGVEKKGVIMEEKTERGKSRKIVYI
jgi:hypothetical protein